jgi:hypothetical protein
MRVTSVRRYLRPIDALFTGAARSRFADYPFLPYGGNGALGKIIGHCPEIELRLLAVDSLADFRWRIQD